MQQKNELRKKIVDFFATRFVLREAGLWRVLGLLKPMKHYVIIANVLLTISAFIGSIVLLSLLPLFQFTINPDRAKDSALIPGTAKQAYAEKKAAQSSGTGVSPVMRTTGETPVPQLAENGSTSTTKAEVKKGAIRKAIDKIPFLKKYDDKIQHALAKYHGKYAEYMLWGVDHKKKFVLVICGVLMAMMILQGLIEFAGDSMLGKVAIDVTTGLLRDVYGNVLDQEMLFFDRTPTGTLINTCYREVFELRNIITFLASTRLMLPIQMFTLFLALLAISTKFTLLLCCLLPLVILPTMLLTRQLKKAIREMMLGEAKPIDIMTETFHGIRAVKAFSAEEYEKQQMAPAIKDYGDFANKRRSSQAMIEPTVDILNTMVIMLVFAAICLFLPETMGNDKADIGPKLLTFMAAVQRFYKPFRQLMTMNLSMQRASAAANRIFTMLDRKPLIVDKPDAVDFPAGWNEVILDDVYLSYEVFFKGQSRLRKALRGINMRIRRGESMAFVGPNGAGKSSIVNLLCRLYDPTGGAIYFDDVPLTQIRMKSLRERVCLITQHPILFNRSVAENIAFGLEGLSQAEIEDAARAVNAHQFILSLPDGYESVIGESGKLLSGGERQKIVLARAFVRRPDILIFDEPTTGLDKQTTEEFLGLINKLHEQKITIIYITHDQTHLARFDRVMQLTPERKIIEVTPEPATEPAAS